MTTFLEFTQNQALRDKLPFSIDFEISPAENGVTENVAGFEFPVYDELLSREAWFFEAIESMNGSKTSELQLAIRNLAKKLMTTCGLESMSDAIAQLFEPSEELVVTGEYQKFEDDNATDIKRLVELFRLAQNNQAVNWLRVTFFLLSRYDAEWTLGKTASLRNSQINAIIKFISKEANGGVDPQALQSEEAQNDAEEAPEGKAGVDATGVSSTGK
ncbi:hypothetical protein [Myxosarcina sp. GI1(2024)]